MSCIDDYEILDHTADIGIKVRGESLNAVMEKTILAQRDLMIGNMQVGSDEEREFIIDEDDAEIALVSILEEILYLFEHQKFAVSCCSVSVQNSEYRVQMKGSLFNRSKVEDGTEIKAVTYHQLKVKKEDASWIVQVIFDI